MKRFILSALTVAAAGIALVGGATAEASTTGFTCRPQGNQLTVQAPQGWDIQWFGSGAMRTGSGTFDNFVGSQSTVRAGTFVSGSNWADWRNNPPTQQALDASGCAGYIRGNDNGTESTVMFASWVRQTERQNSLDALRTNISDFRTGGTWGLLFAPVVGPATTSHAQVVVSNGRVTVNFPGPSESVQWVEAPAGFGLPVGGHDGAINVGQNPRSFYLVTPGPSGAGQATRMTGSGQSFTATLNGQTDFGIIAVDGNPASAQVWHWLQVGPNTEVGAQEVNGTTSHPFFGNPAFFWRAQ